MREQELKPVSDDLSLSDTQVGGEPVGADVSKATAVTPSGILLVAVRYHPKIVAGRWSVVVDRS